MYYKSTRGKIQGLSFEDAVMTGLADDGGLLVPENFPQVHDSLSDWSSYNFSELSDAIMTYFIGSEIPEGDLKELVRRSHINFRHSEVTPVVSKGDVHIVELFHGPTFAFKDVALQFLGNLFEYFLERRGHRITILGSTSGDTGSAAIYGLKGKKNVDVFMLHPKGRVSPIQERQMTTILDENIHNIAVEGNFDDAQAIVKALFNDLSFKQKYRLGAVNSINWARILAQIVYYFYAYLKIAPQGNQRVNFSVPTGNFGDILAGYYAKKMGLPIDKLIVATNQNDILDRFFSQGDYSKKGVVPTWSPSMDIQVSSNFERFLFDLSGQNPEQLVTWMTSFQQTGELRIEGEMLEKAQKEMVSEKVTEPETLETIQLFYKENDYLLDPHTAIGVRAANVLNFDNPTICLATAHPAKFGKAVSQAIGHVPELPPELANLENLEARCQVLPANATSIQNMIVDTLG